MRLWLAGALALGAFYRQTAALRGSHGVPLGPLALLVDRLARVGFVYALFVWPWLRVAPRARRLVLGLFLCYLPFYLDPAELQGGRPRAGRWLGLRHWSVWGWLRGRLRLELVKTGELPGPRYIFGIHPHGVMPWGAFFNFVTEVNQFGRLFPAVDARIAIVTSAFWVPIYRELALWAKVMDCSRYAVRAALERGESVVLVPGGAPEALLASPGRHSLVLNRRRGFVRLALQTATPLVPVYSFGENCMYETVSIGKDSWGGWVLGRLQHELRLLSGVVLPLATNVVPRECSVVTVVGEPISFYAEPIAEPTEEQVDALLVLYTEALRGLFNEFKDKYAPDRLEELDIQ